MYLSTPTSSVAWQAPQKQNGKVVDFLNEG
jgi:hypothetical protein